MYIVVKNTILLSGIYTLYIQEENRNSCEELFYKYIIKIIRNRYTHYIHDENRNRIEIEILATTLQYTLLTLQ